MRPENLLFKVHFGSSGTALLESFNVFCLAGDLRYPIVDVFFEPTAFRRVSVDEFRELHHIAKNVVFRIMVFGVMPLTCSPYRCLGLMLERQGIKLSPKKLYRLYKRRLQEERLTVRKRGGRKRALGTRAPMAIPQARNLRWSLDFVADTLDSGRRFRILTLVDDFTRECLGLVVDTSLTGLRVARELDRIAELRGYPGMIVSDNGTELTSNAILAWQRARGVLFKAVVRSTRSSTCGARPSSSIGCRAAGSRAAVA